VIVDALRAGDGTLLELPAEGAWQIPTVTANAQAMFESIGHWRPLVNGYGGYYPAGFRDTLALANRLPDRTALDELRRRTGVAMILVRGESASPEQRAAFEALAAVHGGPDLRLLVREGPDLLFAVADAPG
jgi:hypothetical protein